MQPLKSVKVRLKRVTIRLLSPLMTRKWRRQLSEKKIEIVFYDRIAAHFGFTHPLITECAKRAPCALIVGCKDHPALHDVLDNILVIYVESSREYLLRELRCKVLVTPGSDFAVMSRPKRGYVLHVLHSLVSLHIVYQPWTFDAYDGFCIAGPHHERELRELKKLRKWGEKDVFRTGYPKLDIIQNLAERRGREQTSDLVNVCFAPSWGPQNLLRQGGKEVVQKIVDMGFMVTVRPHPLSFVYDLDVIGEIKEMARKNTNCVLEGSNPALDGLVMADVVISDWSGVAYEFAFGLSRPVLFFDVPRKHGYAWEELLDFPAMEDEAREKVGKITTLEKLEEDLNDLLTRRNYWRRKIEMASEEYVFNLGNATKTTVECIETIANRN